jgi:hypothetical protein
MPETFTQKIGTPIIAQPGVDADALAKHYVCLHQLQTGPAYAKLGEKVVTEYTITPNPDGSHTIHIVDHHKSSKET